jgi:drug/metabolite transporter (DMT)-like permease
MARTIHAGEGAPWSRRDVIPWVAAALSSTVLLEAGFVLAWSSGFIGARLAAEHAPTFLVLFWRFALAALLLAPLVLSAGVLTRGWRPVAQEAAVGALALVGYLAGVVKAVELGVPAGLSALVAALQPLAAAALAGPFLGERVATRQWVGLVLGLGGVALALGGTLRVGTAPTYAYLLPLLGMLSLVAATLARKRWAASDLPIAASLGVQSAVAAVLFAVLAVAEGRVAPIATVGFVTSVLWFVALSTFGGYGLYWACLRRTSATRVSSLLYLTPPVTMVWAWLMFDETLTAAALAGLVVCLGGVLLAVGRRKTMPTWGDAAR